MALIEIPGEEVHARSRDRRFYWPRRGGHSRLFPDCVPRLRPKFDLSEAHSFFAIGSCFARNIEEYLLRHELRVLSGDLRFPRAEIFPHSRGNDLAVKYTPASVLYEVATALGETTRPSDEEYIVRSGDGGWYDVNLPMSYPPVGFERAVERRSEVRAAFARAPQADVLLMTLGLIEDWYDNRLGLHLNSPPPPRVVEQYPGRFVFQILSYSENLRCVKQAIEIIHGSNARLQVVLTTSPVPLARTYTSSDVIAANNYSKSMLRIIAEDVARELAYVDYFPSYEMVVHSNSASTWEDDLRHVQDNKVGEIMTAFMSAYLSKHPKQEELAKRSRAYIAAQALRSSGAYEDAFHAFAALESDFSTELKFLSEFCEVALRTKRYDEVVRIARRITERQPEFLLAELCQGQALVNLRRFEEAERALGRAAENPRLKARAHRWLMEMWKASGEPERAREHAQIVLAMIEDETAQFPEAIVIRLKRVIASSKRSPDAECREAPPPKPGLSVNTFENHASP